MNDIILYVYNISCLTVFSNMNSVKLTERYPEVRKNILNVFCVLYFSFLRELILLYLMHHVPGKVHPTYKRITVYLSRITVVSCIKNEQNTITRMYDCITDCTCNVLIQFITYTSCLWNGFLSLHAHEAHNLDGKVAQLNTQGVIQHCYNRNTRTRILLIVVIPLLLQIKCICVYVRVLCMYNTGNFLQVMAYTVLLLTSTYT